MDKTWAKTPTTENNAKMDAEIARLFTEMERADERIKQHQDETDKLKQETRIMLDALKAK